MKDLETENLPSCPPIFFKIKKKKNCGFVDKDGGNWRS